MNKQDLEFNLEEFKNGNLIISIHEKYKDDFQEYLKINNITKYWIKKHRVYLNYKTSTLKRLEMRNSEMRIIRRITKEIRLKEISILKEELTKEELLLNKEE